MGNSRMAYYHPSQTFFGMEGVVSMIDEFRETADQLGNTQASVWVYMLAV